LGTTFLRKQALRILEAGLESIGTERLMQEQFIYDAQYDALYIWGEKYSLKAFKKILVVGVGKMTAKAAVAIEEKMLDRISGGLIIDIVSADLKKIISKVGTHPFPSSANVSATEELIAMVEGLTSDDLVIAIIGGGGSSLLTSPKSISIEEERLITQALMDVGADIIEMNTVRKHLSRVKGGGLAKSAYPATMINLIFSDVPGNDISMVASGPTVKDHTTMQDAIVVMDRYKILDRCSIEYCGMVETPKEDKYFAKVHNIVFCSSEIALQAMWKKAQDLGLNTKIWDKSFRGEAKNLAKKILADIQDNQCLIGAGESVVTIKSGQKGSGGRNQEMALAVMLNIPANTVFGAIASDGRDNSDVAGGLVDKSNLEYSEKIGIDTQNALKLHDEYGVVLDINAGIMTGNTGSNVSDLIVCIKQ
jgi:glycerate 2-kinase